MTGTGRFPTYTCSISITVFVLYFNFKYLVLLSYLLYGAWYSSNTVRHMIYFIVGSNDK